MRWRVIYALSISVLISLPSHVAAEPVDACTAAFPDQLSNQSPVRFHARLDRDIAIYVAKHVQRACRRLAAFAHDNSSLLRGTAAATEIPAIVKKMRLGILEPIYRTDPDLWGLGLTERPAPAVDGDTTAQSKTESNRDCELRQASHRAQLGRATAVSFLRVLSVAQTSFLKTTAEPAKNIDPDQSKAFAEQITDVVAEIGFGSKPIYASFPDLWRREVRNTIEQVRPRTGQSNAAFRRAAPAPGTVRMSRAASSQILKFIRSLQREVGQNDQIAAISWDVGRKIKGPNDTDWKKLEPGLGIGTYSRREVPPDVIRTIDGVEIVFSGDDATRFAGKLIDFENGKFVLKKQ